MPSLSRIGIEGQINITSLAIDASLKTDVYTPALHPTEEKFEEALKLFKFRKERMGRLTENDWEELSIVILVWKTLGHVVPDLESNFSWYDYTVMLQRLIGAPINEETDKRYVAALVAGRRLFPAQFSSLSVTMRENQDYWSRQSQWIDGLLQFGTANYQHVLFGEANLRQAYPGAFVNRRPRIGLEAILENLEDTWGHQIPLTFMGPLAILYPHWRPTQVQLKSAHNEVRVAYTDMMIVQNWWKKILYYLILTSDRMVISDKGIELSITEQAVEKPVENVPAVRNF